MDVRIRLPNWSSYITSGFACIWENSSSVRVGVLSVGGNVSAGVSPACGSCAVSVFLCSVMLIAEGSSQSGGILSGVFSFWQWDQGAGFGLTRPSEKHGNRLVIYVRALGCASMAFTLSSRLYSPAI